MRTSSNLSEWENLKGVCGIKIFMGASTGDLMTALMKKLSLSSQMGRESLQFMLKIK